MNLTKSFCVLVVWAFSLASANPKEGKAPIEFKAKIIEDLSSEYFGYLDIDITNNTDKWLIIRDIAITFPQPVQDRNIRMVTGEDFIRWQEVTRKRLAKAELNKNTSLAVIGALGYGLAAFSGNSTLRNAGTVAAAGAIGAYAVSEHSDLRDSVYHTKRFPERHLLADSIVALPGLSEGRWLLFNSRNHDSTKIVQSFTIHYTLNDGSRSNQKIAVARSSWQKRLWWRPSVYNNSVHPGF